MHYFNSKLFAIRSVTLAALCLMLLSFSNKIGGESFTIYLNDELVIEQFVTRDANVKALALSESSADDVLKINYNHCGKIGKGRSITIKDAQNVKLKTWQFPDVSEGKALMTCQVKEILLLQKNNKSSGLSLYYTSKELPEGKLLATIAISNSTKASIR